MDRNAGFNRAITFLGDLNERRRLAAPLGVPHALFTPLDVPFSDAALLNFNGEMPGY